MKFSHDEEVVVRTHEVDKDKKMHVPSMLMVMQEASMQNVLKLKASVWDMEGDQISWVLLRKELIIYERPTLGDKIIITTYPAGFDRVFAYRDFWVKDSNGKILATAGSTWTLLNILTRKMVRIPQKFYSFQTEEKDDFLDRPQSRIEILKEVEFIKDYEVGYYDLDWNGHVNNNVLSRLILQSIPHMYHTDKTLSKMTFHIKSECFLDERLQIQFGPGAGDKTLHTIRSENDQRTIVQACCEWQ